MIDLAKILLHEGAGEASFLVDGHKMPHISPDYHVTQLGHGVIGVTVTFLADDVLILSRNAARDEARRIVANAFKETP